MTTGIHVCKNPLPHFPLCTSKFLQNPGSKGHTEVVRLLLFELESTHSSQEVPASASALMETSLVLAAGGGHSEVVRLLVHGLRPWEEFPQGRLYRRVP